MADFYAPGAQRSNDPIGELQRLRPLDTVANAMTNPRLRALRYLSPADKEKVISDAEQQPSNEELLKEFHQRMQRAGLPDDEKLFYGKEAPDEPESVDNPGEETREGTPSRQSNFPERDPSTANVPRPVPSRDELEQVRENPTDANIESYDAQYGNRGRRMVGGYSNEPAAEVTSSLDNLRYRAQRGQPRSDLQDEQMLEEVRRKMGATPNGRK